MERILHIECCLPLRYRKKEILNLGHFSLHKMESTPQNGLKFQCSSYSVAPCSKRHARPGIGSGYSDAAWLWRRWLPLTDFDSYEIRSFVQNYSGHNQLGAFSQYFAYRPCPSRHDFCRALCPCSGSQNLSIRWHLATRPCRCLASLAIPHRVTSRKSRWWRILQALGPHVFRVQGATWTGGG